MATTGISIHAPLAGCDHPYAAYSLMRDISIHAPLAGCDFTVTIFSPVFFLISIHAPLAGCDVGMPLWHRGKRNFNPRTPCGVRHP